MTKTKRNSRREPRIKPAVGKNRTITLWLLFVVVCVLAYYPSYAEDNDIWFHLRYGQHYVQNWTWKIDHSEFSWTPATADWKYITWIGSSVLYLAHAALGLAGLYVVQWLVLLGIFLLYLKLIHVAGDTLDANHLVGFLLLAIALSLTAVYIKPEIFSTLFFSVIAFAYFNSKLRGQNLFALLPPLFVIWVNTHGGFILGLLFLTMAFAAELLQYWLVRNAAMESRLLKQFGIYTGLCFVAILLNPYGPVYHMEILRNMFSKEYMGDATQLFAYYNMWDYLFVDKAMYRFSNGAWALVAMAFLAVVAWVFAYRQTRYVDPAIILLNSAFFLMGMNTARITIFFPLIWFPSMVCLVCRARIGPGVKRFARSVSPIVLFFLGGSLLYLMFFYSAHKLWFGYRSMDFYPVKEIEFIRNNRLPAPIFNDYALGGYLLWGLYPDYKVFIDPRYGPYVKQVWQDWVGLKDSLNPEGLETFTRKYPFKVALISLREIYLIGWFLDSPDWKLLYYDRAAAILVHQSVLSTLKPEALTVDLNVSRFRGVKDPLILMRLFNFCVRYRIQDARIIMSYYREKVPDYYAFKEEDLEECRNALLKKEQGG